MRPIFLVLGLLLLGPRGHAAAITRRADFRVVNEVPYFAGARITDGDVLPLEFFLDLENINLRAADDARRQIWLERMSDKGRVAAFRRLLEIFRWAPKNMPERAGAVQFFCLDWTFRLLHEFLNVPEKEKDYRSRLAFVYFSGVLRNFIAPLIDTFGARPKEGEAARVRGMHLLLEVLSDRPVHLGLQTRVFLFHDRMLETLMAQWSGGENFIPEVDPELLQLSLDAQDLIKASRCETGLTP